VVPTRRRSRCHRASVSRLDIDPDTGASQMPIVDPVETRIVSHHGAAGGSRRPSSMPAGCTEATQAHAVFGGHSLTAKPQGVDIARRLGNALVAPLIPFSIAGGHLNPKTPGLVNIPGHLRRTMRQSSTAWWSTASRTRKVVTRTFEPRLAPAQGQTHSSRRLPTIISSMNDACHTTPICASSVPARRRPCQNQAAARSASSYACQDGPNVADIWDQFSEGANRWR
jgi:hypothetical protein